MEIARFRRLYGPVAVVAGAAEGLGAAFARELAARGLDVVLLDVARAPLEALATELAASHGVRARAVTIDLADPRFADAFSDEDVGLGVYNAAFAPLGDFATKPLDDLLRALDVNCRGPLVLARALAPRLASRGRGGLLLMSSMAGYQGTPRLAVYAATKAWNRVLAEGLWAEFGPAGVHVAACAPGAIRTPGYLRTATREAPGILEPADVARAALDGLARGPVVVPGVTNRVGRFVLGSLVPLRAAIRMMERSTRELR